MSKAPPTIEPALVEEQTEKPSSTQDIAKAVSEIDPVIIQKQVNDPAEENVRARISRIVQKLQDTQLRILAAEVLPRSEAQHVLWENASPVDLAVIDSLGASAEQAINKPAIDTDLDQTYRSITGEVDSIVQYARLPFSPVKDPDGNSWIATIATHRSFNKMRLGTADVAPGVPVRSISFRKVPTISAQ